VTPAFLTAAGGGDPKVLAKATPSTRIAARNATTWNCSTPHGGELAKSRRWHGEAGRVNTDQQQRIIDYIAAAQKVVEKSPGE